MPHTLKPGVGMVDFSMVGNYNVNLGGVDDFTDFIN
jgi:hypothetical protein